MRRGFDVIGGARFNINNFTRDVLMALQAAEDERSAVAATRAAAEAEIEAEIDRRRARSEKAIQAIREEILAKYGLTE